MQKYKQRVLILGIAVLAIVFLLFSFTTLTPQLRQSERGVGTPTAVVPPRTQQVSYNGQDGVDALTLLKQHADVVQDQSGMVVSINGRKADSTKREYWAFFINNALAPVGPQAYTTKKGDNLTWKIASY